MAGTWAFGHFSVAEAFDGYQIVHHLMLSCKRFPYLGWRFVHVDPTGRLRTTGQQVIMLGEQVHSFIESPS